MTKLLLANGADVDGTNSASETPLYVAIKHEHLDIITLLLESGDDVNMKYPMSTESPLHVAIKFGLLNVFEVLLSYGADVHARNPHFNTPLHVAIGHEQLDMIRPLLESGADVWAIQILARRFVLLLNINI